MVGAASQVRADGRSHGLMALLLAMGSDCRFPFRRVRV